MNIHHLFLFYLLNYFNQIRFWKNSPEFIPELPMQKEQTKTHLIFDC